MQKTLRRCASFGAVAALVLAGSAGAQFSHVLTNSSAAQAAALNADWPMYGNTSDNTHYSPLTQITAANVSQLGVAWQQQEGENISIFENMPVVVNGVMYYTTNTDQVRAVDGATGNLLWQYTPKVNFYTGLAGGGGGIQVNRGVAVANGSVYLATADAQMIALQAATGEELWSTYIAPPSAGYSESSGPTYWNGMLFIGAALGDSGQRGFVEALDANTGKQLWRFYTVPAAGQGWNQPASAHHGGGDVWMPITIDTTTGTVYAGTGNPSPDFDNSQRPGCDPWADSIVALDAKTGKFKWAHSEVCNDVWDYDSMPQPFLMNIPINGVVTRVVGHTNKSGFITFYNAATGNVIATTPHLSVYNVPHPKPSPAGAKVCTGTQGGTEFEPASYSPITQLVYQSYANGCFIFKIAPISETNGHQFNQFDLAGSTTLIPGTVSGGLAAVDPITGKVVWKTPFKLPSYSGALSTASGLVFVGDDDGYFRALDATSGKVLWKVNLGLAFGAPPIAYAINGTEYIAIAVGGSDNSSSYDTAPFGGTMIAFKLGGKPATKLPVVNGATGTAKLPPLTGYTQINKYMWALPAKKIVVIQVIAGSTSVNNGFNFDGYYNGQATFTVPQFWSAFIEFKNDAALPHSAAVTLGHVAPATVLQGVLGPVETPNATQGTTGNLWEIIGGGGFPVVADTAGKFYLSCLVPGHLASGMWDNFVVSPTATMPSITAPGM